MKYDENLDKDNANDNEFRMGRLLNIIDLIMTMQARTQGVSLVEIQEMYSISRRTAQRMKDIVMTLFPQVTELQTEGKTKRWGFKGKPANLYDFSTDDIADLISIKELCKINNMESKAVVLDKVITSIKSSKNPNLTSIETDLEALVGSVGYSVKQSAGFYVDYNILKTIKTAFKSMKKLSFDYQAKEYYDTNEKNLAGFKIQKGLKAKKEVVIEPYGILYGERHYLVGKDPKSGKIKNYLLHRISNIQMSNEYFEPDASFDLEEWSNLSFGKNIMDIKLKFKKEIADDVLNYKFNPTQKIEQLKNGAVVVTFKTSRTKSVLWNLFKWGTNVEIVAPKELKESYKTYLAEILKNY